MQDARSRRRDPQCQRRFRSSACTGRHPAKIPILDLPDLGWSFLHAVPPIGTKFALPDVLGPQSQPTTLNTSIEGELTLTIAR